MTPKARTLIHVGLPKTGTTSVQNYLHKHGSVTPGVHYCHYFEGSTIQSRCFSNAVGLGRDSGVHLPPADYLKGIERAFREGAHTAVISDEVLSRVQRIDVAQFREMLAGLRTLSTVEVVMGVRPWFSWLESLINQSVKSGHFSVESFHAADAVEIGLYPLNILSVYEFYRSGAGTGKPLPVHILRQPDDILSQFEHVLGCRVFDRDLFEAKNRSPSLRQSLNMYLAQHNGAPLTGAVPGNTFLSAREADALYAANRDWIGTLCGLDPALAHFDDYAVFRKRTGDTGALDALREGVAELQQA